MPAVLSCCGLAGRDDNGRRSRLAETPASVWAALAPRRWRLRPDFDRALPGQVGRTREGACHRRADTGPRLLLSVLTCTNRGWLRRPHGHRGYAFGPCHVVCVVGSELDVTSNWDCNRECTTGRRYADGKRAVPPLNRVRAAGCMTGDLDRVVDRDIRRTDGARSLARLNGDLAERVVEAYEDHRRGRVIGEFDLGAVGNLLVRLGAGDSPAGRDRDVDRGVEPMILSCGCHIVSPLRIRSTLVRFTSGFDLPEAGPEIRIGQ